MKIKTYLITLLCLMYQVSFAQTWQAVGLDQLSYSTVSYINMAFDGTTPYVVYQDGSNSNKATVKKFNGSTWETVGTAGFSAGAATNTKLAFEGTTPYVVYADGANLSKVTVQKFNGTTWETVGTAGFSEAQADFISLAINGTTPYVAYQDYAKSNKITVQKFNGSTWETVDTAGFSVGAAFYIDLAFNGTTPYVVYVDDGNDGKVAVKKFNGITWEAVDYPGYTESFGLGLSSYSSLAFKGTTPYVIYSYGYNSSKATVKNFNGSFWEAVGTEGFSAGAAYYTKLIFDGTTPYAVYGDGTNSFKATVQKFNGTAWETVGTAGFSEGTVDYISMISTGSELMVAYNSPGGAFVKSFPLGTLPVKLTKYEALVKYEKQVNLTWETASETNNNYYTLSKSHDGKTFETVGTVKSKGNGAHYETIDYRPYQGVSYYKLSQTDLDGKTKELGIKSVKLESLKRESLLVYPNPIVNGVMNIIHTNLNGLQSIKMIDLSGKEVLNDKVNFNNGVASYKIDTKLLVKGTYILKIGNAQLSTQIIVD